MIGLPIPASKGMWKEKTLLVEYTVTPSMISSYESDYLGADNQTAVRQDIDNSKTMYVEITMQKSNDVKMLIDSFIFDRADVIGGNSSSPNSFTVRRWNQNFSYWFARQTDNIYTQFVMYIFSTASATYRNDYTYKCRVYKLA